MSNISLKSVKDLLDKKFLIPSYQRGYRWTEYEVESLLNDLHEYSQDIKCGRKFYCLQPLVVKNKGSEYEVIDGQQRLTTIYLILKFLEPYAENCFGKKDFPVFLLNYEVRKDCIEFFKTKRYEKKSDENLDFMHISNAFSVIKDWFGSDIASAQKKTEFFNLLFANDFTAKFIWYEVPSDENAYDVFKRLNSGKLSLTNSELVKALILNDEDKDSCFNQEDIAREWEFIESRLENDDFWYFINSNPEDEKYQSTRMDFILESLLRSQNIEIKDNYFIFSELNDQISNDWKTAFENINATYRTFQSWYDDRELYHYIGFLMNAKGSQIFAGSLINNYMNSSKSEFRESIKTKCKEIIGKKFSKLSYDKDKDKIYNVLLAFNLATTLNQISEMSRYPFKSHFEARKKRWSLEHIHAQNEHQSNWNEDELRQLKADMKTISELSPQKEDIEALANFITDENLKVKETYNAMMAVFMGEKITLHRDSNGEISSVDSEFEKDDTLMNLALLQADKNSAFNNKTFLEKRRILSGYENAETETQFIPICTRNVFFKHYSPESTNPLVWDRAAGKDYVRTIMNVVGKFVGAEPFDSFDKKTDLKYGLK